MGVSSSLFHCKPDVPHYANNRSAGKLIPGQCFTIEPMICVGDAQDVHWRDNVRLLPPHSLFSVLTLSPRSQWTAATRDGQNSAQFEETLLVTETGIEVLTARPGWVLPPVGTQGWRTTYGGGAAKKRRNKKKKAKKAAGAEEMAVDAEEEGEEGEEGVEES